MSSEETFISVVNMNDILEWVAMFISFKIKPTPNEKRIEQFLTKRLIMDQI